MVKDMTKTQPQIPCPKCSGTGTVARFLDHDGGRCYDCDGAGTITAAPVVRGRRRWVRVAPEMVVVGLVVRSLQRVEPETVARVYVDELGWTVMVTDAGNEYAVHPAHSPQVVLA